MARPREFDEGAVLDAAIRQFWLRGYEATSVRKLADEMGIAGASLYNTFSDKRALYRAALNRYLEQAFRERIVRLERSLPPKEAVETFFREIIDKSLGDRRCRGCMLVNAALEHEVADRDSRAIVLAFLEEAEAFFLRSMVAGQRQGTISTTQSASDLARMLFGQLLGIRVLARVKLDRELLEGMVRPALHLVFSSDGLRMKARRKPRSRT